MEAGTVTAAAKRLNLSKSVISKRISDLEAALDVELFRRSTGQIRSTESADALYERMVPLIQEINEAAERVSRSQQALQGRLRLEADSGIVYSMNRSGNVWDNAAMESFQERSQSKCIPITSSGSTMRSGVIRRSDTSALLSSTAR